MKNIEKSDKNIAKGLLTSNVREYSEYAKEFESNEK